MKVYWYHRKDRKTGKEAKEWSYRLPPDLRSIPKDSWPENFRFNGTLYTSKDASVIEIDLIIQNAKRKALHIAAGMPVISQNSIDMDIADYLAWGASQAGKLDDGWSPSHLAHKKTYLKEWVRRLNLSSVGDITFDAFDRELSLMKAAGAANNTVNNWGHALSGLTKYCKRRKRLAYDPLEEWVSLKKVIKNPRGHYYPDEVLRLFEETPEEDAITYQMAYYTRYREGELYDLTVKSIHWTHGLVELPPQHTKNGKVAFQPLPEMFLGILWSYVHRLGLKGDDPLLIMSKNHPERRLYKHLDRLGISRMRDGKRRDFHALGHSTATNMTVLGVSTATIQKGMRHGSLRQTLDYVAAEALPVRAAVNALARQLYPHAPAQPSGTDSHHFHTKGDSVKLNSEVAETYGGDVRGPSPSATFTRFPSAVAHTPAQSSASKSRKNSRSFLERRTSAQIPYSDAREILTRISHRLPEVGFADLLRELVAASPEKISQALAVIKAGRQVAG